MAQPSQSAGGGAPPHGPWSGGRLVPEAFRLLLRHRGLWPLAAAPVALTALFLSVALGLAIEYAPAIYAWIAGWIPTLEADTWYAWIWVGPGRVLLALAGYALFGIALALMAVLSFGLANVLSAPILDVLSQKVERIETGGLVESGEGGLWALVRESGRSLGNELRRLAFLALVCGVIVVAGAVVPGAQPLAPPALGLVTLLFLPLDYGGYVMDRRGVSFRSRRIWLRRNLGVAVGFGAVAFATLCVPLLNFLLLPILVTAGTLLAVRCPAAEVSRRSRGADAGSSTSP
ncbi:MAG: EI24 domain-containing protein [Myxococcota bacterium]